MSGSLIWGWGIKPFVTSRRAHAFQRFADDRTFDNTTGCEWPSVAAALPDVVMGAQALEELRGQRRPRRTRWGSRVGAVFAPVCVSSRHWLCLPSGMRNSRAPSLTLALSCIFAVDQCDRGECGKNGSFRET